MPISFSRYVDITSGVAGASTVPTRRLIGRCFTSSALLPPQSFITFSGDNALADVGNFFGFASQEYARASFYFGWISKNITRAKAIDFARWVSFATAPMIYGTKTAKLLATFQNITAGSFTLALGGVSHTFTGLDFSDAASLAAVATIVQTAINNISGTLWSAATVAFDATTQRFNFVGGVAGACTLSVTDGTQSVAATLGWVPPLPSDGQQLSTSINNFAVWAPGAAAEEAVAAVSNSAVASNNFGSFLFQDALTLDEGTAVGQWAASQNVLYRYCIPLTASNAADWEAALGATGGCDPVLSPIGTQYPEMCPMIQEAATDYTARNGTSNYMYSVFGGLTPSVANDDDANTYDALAVNYYGNTQNAGAPINFYQRGYMWGGPNDPLDENVFSNESWLKSDAGARIMNLQLGLPKISANASGRSQILNALQGTIGQALFNGTISVGKPLTVTQQEAITSFTGDAKAWYQVQNQGYWVDVVIAPFTNQQSGRTEYRATYTLVYSKDDVVRRVDGTHVLI